jgi:hypothetical protein
MVAGRNFYKENMGIYMFSLNKRKPTELADL